MKLKKGSLPFNNIASLYNKTSYLYIEDAPVNVSWKQVKNKKPYFISFKSLSQLLVCFEIISD